MNFTVNNQEYFSSNSFCTALIQGLSTISKAQMPTLHVFRKEHSLLASDFSTFCHLVSLVVGLKQYNLK
jgi:hypothetical protein